MNIEDASARLYGEMIKKKVKCYVGYDVDIDNNSLGTINVVLHQEKVPKLPSKYEGHPVHIIKRKTQ